MVNMAMMGLYLGEDSVGTLSQGSGRSWQSQ